MTSKVSVIIPVYNATKIQLTASISSVIKQTYSNIELIIINDKSTKEETTALLNKYSKIDTFNFGDGRLRYIKLYNNQQNVGISSSRNKGIEESTGDYICFLDQDDYYDLDYVAKLVEAIESEKADIAMCGFYSLDESGDIIDTFPKGGMDTTSPWYPWSICSIWNRIYKREFIQKYNIRFPDGCVTEDIVFLMQCSFFATKTAVVKEQLYRNVIRQSSTSHSKEFHALKLNQMPFDQISKLLEATTQASTIDATNAFGQKGNVNITSASITTTSHINATQLRSKYLQALMCNEMALLSYILSIGSDTYTVKEATKRAGNIIRQSASRESLKYIHQFNRYCKDKKSMQVLNLLIYYSSRLHVEVQAAMLVRKIIKWGLQ